MKQIQLKNKNKLVIKILITLLVNWGISLEGFVVVGVFYYAICMWGMVVVVNDRKHDSFVRIGSLEVHFKEPIQFFRKLRHHAVSGSLANILI